MRDFSSKSLAGMGMIALVLCCAFSAWGETMHCAMCGKAIHGEALRVGERFYCSRTCYRKSLPRCCVCGKPIEGRYLLHNGKRYCSKTCFESILPKCTICHKPLEQCYRIAGKPYCKRHAEGPRCEACGLPVDPGILLPDGRRICAACRPHLVLTAARAEKLYLKAAATLRHIVGEDLPLIPPLHLVGCNELPPHADLVSSPGTHEQGRYVRHVETTTVSVLGIDIREQQTVQKDIFILYGLTRARFLSTAAHELMHDIISEQYPAFDVGAPDWAEEGVCQYAAALLCRQLGFADRLAEIETAGDPIYGGGYRYVAHTFGENNWPAVARWMKQDGFADLPPHTH